GCHLLAQHRRWSKGGCIPMTSVAPAGTRWMAMTTQILLQLYPCQVCRGLARCSHHLFPPHHHRHFAFHASWLIPARNPSAIQTDEGALLGVTPIRLCLRVLTCRDRVGCFLLLAVGLLLAASSGEQAEFFRADLGPRQPLEDLGRLPIGPGGPGQSRG